MKIFHISDTHIGYSAYRKATPDGINQREYDTYNAFKQFVNYALDIKPDLIIHSGDLFDSVRPNNRAITFAIKQLIRISKAKIPFVVIAGNHEHPKLKETGHIFSVFDHIENIYPGKQIELLKSAVIESFSEFFEKTQKRNKIVSFVKKQLKSDSPKTRKIARDFINKWGRD